MSINQQPGSQHGTDLHPLHTCDSYVACCFWNSWQWKQVAVPDALTGFWEHIPHLDQFVQPEYRGRYLAL